MEYDQDKIVYVGGHSYDRATGKATTGGGATEAKNDDDATRHFVTRLTSEWYSTHGRGHAIVHVVPRMRNSRQEQRTLMNDVHRMHDDASFAETGSSMVAYFENGNGSTSSLDHFKRLMQ